MLADFGPASLASASDAELAALEKDTSLPTAAWAAVAGEQARRAARRREAGAEDDTRALTPEAAAPAAAAPPAAEPAEPSGEDARVVDALQQLRGLLLPGETLEAWAVQRRLFALTHRRTIVAATSGRFVSFARGLLGGYTVGDVRWQDLRDAQLRAGIFGADLTITALTTEDLGSEATDGTRITYAGLRKDAAQTVYRACQAREQAWREKRRVRELDELRARSGGIQLGAGGAAPPGPSSAAAGDAPTLRLQRAREMLDAGLITDAEYEAIKARVIDGL